MTQVSDVEVIEGGKSTSFIFTYLLPGNIQKKEVVRVPRFSTPADLEKTARLMTFLNRAGTRVPLPLQNGDHWQRFEYVPGTHFPATDEALQEAAREIAKMHLALKAYPLDDFDEPYGTLDLDRWQGALSKIKDSAVTKAIAKDSWIIEERGRVSTFLEKRKTPQQVIHADLHPDNLLYLGNKLTAILDFGNASRGTLGMDVAMACHRLARKITSKKAVRNFMDAYLEQNPGFNDADALPVFMRESLLRKVGAVLTGHATGDRTEKESLREIEKFILLLREVELMEKEKVLPL